MRGCGLGGGDFRDYSFKKLQNEALTDVRGTSRFSFYSESGGRVDGRISGACLVGGVFLGI